MRILDIRAAAERDFGILAAPADRAPVAGQQGAPPMRLLEHRDSEQAVIRSQAVVVRPLPHLPRRRFRPLIRVVVRFSRP